MIKSILVGLDGSAYSDVAVAMGLGWAKRSDALLVGIGIIDAPGILEAEPVPLGAGAYKKQRDEAVLGDARRKVAQFLERFALRCAAEGVACKVLEEVGTPWEQVVREAQRYDLVLLGRRTYFEHDPSDGIDATLAEVVRHAPRPVVTAPETPPSGRGVLVAYDGSLPAARAVQQFQALGLDEGEEVLVLTVGEQFTPAAECAGRAVDYLTLHGIKAKAMPLDTTDAPAAVILEQVRRLDPQLLVMGAHGRPAWREVLFGSTTRRLLRTSPVPVLVSL